MTAQTLSPLETAAVERLDTATDWLIRYGAFIVRMRGKDFLKAKLTEQGPVLLWVTPQVDENDTIASFRIKAAGYNYDIEALYSATLGGDVFSYWRTHITAQDWATPQRGCRFHITRARTDGKQDVLVSSEQFIPAYKTASGTVFALPLDRLEMRYKLRAWRFPGCFEGTDLAQEEVLFDPDGKLITRPAQTP